VLPDSPFPQERIKILKYRAISADMAGCGDCVQEPQLCQIASAVEGEDIFTIGKFHHGK
jgi:hypothetical protein